MLTLGIRYLTGCVTASDPTHRARVEWPPHPGRIYMALAAAHFETGELPERRAALEWLETLGPPRIAAPEYHERTMVTQYVPVNDKAGPSKAPLQSAAGLTRARQPRTFARAWLESEFVYLQWPAENATAERITALDAVCQQVTRVGHSSSLVQMWAAQESAPLEVNWSPDKTAPTHMLRTVGPGTLTYLERQYNRQALDEYFSLCQAAEGVDKRAVKAARQQLREQYDSRPPQSLRPEISLWSGYRQVKEKEDDEAPQALCTVFTPKFLMLEMKRTEDNQGYRALDLVATLQITDTLRKAFIEKSAEIEYPRGVAPEILTGHSATGRSEAPHIAFFPLPFVGHEHADGSVLGIGIATPTGMTYDERQVLLRALNKINQLTLGKLGVWDLRSPSAREPAYNLRERVWTARAQGARQWGTVTPIVLDRHAGARDRAAYQQELAESIRASCLRMFPGHEDLRVEVVVTAVSPHLGAPAAHEYPRLKRKDGTQCRHTHAVLIFDKPVCGPLLIGAGRYRGYGLCRPLT